MLRALIVDDNADFLAGVREIAEQEGFEVEGAHSLAEARARLGGGAPDLVIVDLVLPDGNGIDLLRDLKETTSCDVLLISGMATVDSAIDALRLGALDYLVKPLDTRRLRAALANVLRLRSPLQVLHKTCQRRCSLWQPCAAPRHWQCCNDLLSKVKDIFG